MVARGDMGVEIAIETVPIAQKRLIRTGFLAAKPVITATQMLESMIESPMPTRAEASDVANACFDSTSAVMLSGETAIGRFPVKVVETMSAIIRAVETEFDYDEFHRRMPLFARTGELPAVLSYNALSVAYEIGGRRDRRAHRDRPRRPADFAPAPRMPIFAFTKERIVYNQLAMNWGVYPFMLAGPEESMDALIAETLDSCRFAGVLKRATSWSSSRDCRSPSGGRPT